MVATSAGAQQDLAVDMARLERITTAFQGWVDQGKLPGAVVVVSRYDKVVHSKAIGLRDREQRVG